MDMENRCDWKVCGRIVGTATGWDQNDTYVLLLYDFVPANSVNLQSGTVTFDFENGKVESYSDDGQTLVSVDLIDAIKHLPVTPEEV